MKKTAFIVLLIILLAGAAACVITGYHTAQVLTFVGGMFVPLSLLLIAPENTGIGGSLIIGFICNFFLYLFAGIAGKTYEGSFALLMISGGIGGLLAALYGRKRVAQAAEADNSLDVTEPTGI